MEIQIAEEESAKQQAHFRDLKYWEGRALSFAGYAAITRYAEGFLGLMEVSPDWTVLDMACGGGTLAIPLASRVKRITAVDFSRNMLSILERRCRENGITNIDIIMGSWDDDWKSLGIGEHDVAIASRSLHEENASHYIQKLNQTARRQVYISAPVGHGPRDARLCEFAGRTCSMGADYSHFYNILYHMGIRPNVSFVEECHRSRWKTHEEALEDQRWMFHNMTSEEEEKVKVYLDQNLIYRDGQWQLPYERKCHWAVMWWPKG